MRAYAWTSRVEEPGERSGTDGWGEEVDPHDHPVLLAFFGESLMRLVRFALIFAAGMYLGFQIGGRGLEATLDGVKSFVERLERSR
jgi:hypothetical protein